MFCAYSPSSPHELHPVLSPLPSLCIRLASTAAAVSAKRVHCPTPGHVSVSASSPKRQRTGEQTFTPGVGSGLPRRRSPLPTMTPLPLERCESSGASSSSASSSTPTATITPSFLKSIQQVRLGSSSPPPPSDGQSQAARSPPVLVPGLTMKRSNPKGLSLSLASSFHSTTEEPSSSPSPSPTPALLVPDASPPSSRASQATQTPSTSGPPSTPALGGSGSWGRSSGKDNRRPSLLSLITHPPGNDSTVPPTPGHAPLGYTTIRNRGHARNGSAGAQIAAFSNYSTTVEPRGSQSAYPALRGGFAPRDERQPNRFALNVPGPSSSVSASSASASNSIASTPSTSPPGASGDERELSYLGGICLPTEPYADGPIEVIPGVWLGAEDSLWSWDVWAKNSPKVTIVNVAQEIENPFDPDTPHDSWEWNSAGKAKVSLTEHDADDHPQVEYAHLRWSHGEGGLADMPGEAHLENVVSGETACSEQDKWCFWQAIRWLELRRRVGVPIMIHCQCGVSRSATLAVAYVMTLAAAGLVPSVLGRLRTMQDAYDYVKAKSPWIGPNVSLVFQLVEYARNLSSLLSAHVTEGVKTWDTEWPTLVDIESEDAWARRRLEFGEDADGPEEEARALDKAMVARAGRE